MPEIPPSEQPEQWDKVGQQFAVAFAETLGRMDWAKGVASILADTVGQLLGVAFTLTVPIGTGLAKGIAQAEDLVAPSLAPIAAAAASDMFGVDVPESVFASKRNRGGRTSAADALGRGILEKIKGGATTIEPGSAGAERYLGMVLNMALEGWYQGWFFEFMTSLVPGFDIGQIESFAELDDTLAQALGLGRLSRRVLGPIVNATVVTPLEWQVNKTYRPNLLSESMAVRQFLRGKWNRPQLDEELARQGWSAERIQAYVDQASHAFSPADVRQFVEREYWDRTKGLEHLKVQGYTDQEAEDALRLGGLARIEQLEGQIAAAAIGAYAAGNIDRSTFDGILARGVNNVAERALYTELAEVRAAVSQTDLSHSEVRTAVKKGILTTADYRAWLERNRYMPAAAAALELLLRTEISEDAKLEELRAQQAAERAAEKEAREAERAARKKAIEDERALHRRGAETDLERAVVRGLVRADRLAEVLREKYDPDTVSLLLDLVEQDRLAYLEQQRRAEAARQRGARRNIDVGALERAVYTHILTTQEFRARLEQLGFEPADAALLEATVAATLADRDAVRDKRTEAERRAAQKHIDLGRAELLVRRGVYTLNDYDGLLRSLEFADADRAAMLDYLQLLMQDDAIREEERRNAEIKLRVKGISLEQFRRAVVLGAMTRSAYEQFLVAQGFTADAQIALMADLDDAVAEAERARRRRTEAEGRSGRPVLPLSTVARAARLGLIPPATYEARLAADGYDREDIAIERDLLVFEMAELAAAKRRRDELEAERATPDLSLASVASAVKLGVATIEQYRARAISLGYVPADVTMLVSVLQEELQTLADARERRRAIEEELRPRNLSIAQLEQAVKGGLMTVAQFIANVQALGYLEDDAELLATLLVDELVAAADRGSDGR